MAEWMSSAELGYSEFMVGGARTEIQSGEFGDDVKTVTVAQTNTVTAKANNKPPSSLPQCRAW